MSTYHLMLAGLMLPLAVNCAAAQANPGTNSSPPEQIVVTATRSVTGVLDVAGNIAQIGPHELGLTAATHAYELSVRVPGAWISRNSGQEQLTALRSPVLTGAGSCGAFLMLEDGIPTRPAGFCNVNQMFEVPTELAERIEVIRGPTTAWYGSNGLHGAINTLLPVPGAADYTGVTLEAGSNHFKRGQFNWNSGEGERAYAAGLMLDHDGGYRDDSGYEQIKGFVKSRHEKTQGILDLSISISDLDQETAGYVTGFEAYKDPVVRFTNPNPEAFREAGSRRLSATWQPTSHGKWRPEYRAYLRNSDMDFLQHFLPGKPLEENGQTSGGLMYTVRKALEGGGELAVGVDSEIGRGWLRETQDQPTEGSDFLQETRPVGKHYDYSVISYMLAAHASARLPLSERWELQAGVRGEFLRYDYDNKMLDGNTRDDGSECGYGGCQYARPADRTDNFSNLAPNIGLLYRFNDSTSGFINLTRGFRAPQATELYRLQRSQEVADIDSEKINSAEAGLRHQSEKLRLELTTYYMRKENFIFRDASDFNVSDGKTRHVGIEADANWQFSDHFYAGFTGSWSDQEYRFSAAADLRETIVKGNQVDTAPQTLMSARLGYRHARGSAELEWAYTDAYFRDAANTARYDGHQLLNLRLLLELSRNWTAGLRLTNLTDTEYADRADLVSIRTPPVYRYFTGHPREIYVSLNWQM